MEDTTIAITQQTFGQNNYDQNLRVFPPTV